MCVVSSCLHALSTITKCYNLIIKNCIFIEFSHHSTPWPFLRAVSHNTLIVMTQMFRSQQNNTADSLMCFQVGDAAVVLNRSPGMSVSLSDLQKWFFFAAWRAFLGHTIWFSYHDNLWILSSGPPEMRRHRRRIWLSPRVRCTF